MPLKIILKSEEKIIIGNAFLINKGPKTSLIIMNKVPIVREKDVIRIEEADTPAKKLHYVILSMYISNYKEKQYLDLYIELFNEILSLYKNDQWLTSLTKISQFIFSKNYYRAIKECQSLVSTEQKLGPLYINPDPLSLQEDQT